MAFVSGFFLCAVQVRRCPGGMLHEAFYNGCRPVDVALDPFAHISVFSFRIALGMEVVGVFDVGNTGEEVLFGRMACGFSNAGW